jgi:hypothetical protein
MDEVVVKFEGMLNTTFVSRGCPFLSGNACQVRGIGNADFCTSPDHTLCPLNAVDRIIFEKKKCPTFLKTS